MKLRLIFSLTLMSIGLLMSLSTDCRAQWHARNQPLQKPGRFLGGGWSSGYHWRNPGHDARYYNPYSHHNSSLKSNGLNGSNRYWVQGDNSFSNSGRMPYDGSESLLSLPDYNHVKEGIRMQGNAELLYPRSGKFQAEVTSEDQSGFDLANPKKDGAIPKKPVQERLQQKKESRLERKSPNKGEDWPFPID